VACANEIAALQALQPTHKAVYAFSKVKLKFSCSTVTDYFQIGG